MKKCSPEAATRIDPYGEFGHVEPTSLEEAARLYREALHNGPSRETTTVDERIQLIADAEHRLKAAAFEGR